MNHRQRRQSAGHPIPRRVWRRLTAGCAAMLVVTACLAHHSFAMFDMRQSLTLKGTVKQFQWTNPHCFIQVLVLAEGATKEWSVELHSPGDMYRHGWRPGTLKPGDTVTVVIHPDRDGTTGGLFVSAIGPDGKSLILPGAAEGPRT